MVYRSGSVLRIACHDNDPGKDYEDRHILAMGFSTLYPACAAAHQPELSRNDRGAKALVSDIWLILKGAVCHLDFATGSAGVHFL